MNVYIFVYINDYDTHGIHLKTMNLLLMGQKENENVYTCGGECE